MDHTTDRPTAPADATRRRRPLWLRAIKWTAIIIAVLALIVTGLIGVAVWYLNPARLTPIVNRVASSYLNATVDARRVELTFWHTFPRLEVTVDSLCVVSRSLSDIPQSLRATLPSDADTLLRVERFSGGINIAELSLGNIALYDVAIQRPDLLLVVATDSISNFMILPATDTAATDGATVIPPISINRFAIVGDFPIRYCAPADSIDFTVTLRDSEMRGHDAPLYSLSVAGEAGGNISPLLIHSVPFGIDGKIDWSQTNPEAIGLENMKVTVGGIKASFSTRLDFADDLTVSSLSLDLPSTPLSELLAVAPESLTASLRDLSTDLSVKLKANLTKEYHPLTDSLPSVDVDAEASASRLDFRRLHLRRLAIEGSASIIGDSLDLSTIDIRRIKASGRAIDVDLKATVARPLSNPRLKGHFDGSVNLAVLPPELLAKLPYSITGTLRGETDFGFTLADLTPQRFHRVMLDGMLSLTDFNLASADSTLTAYTAHAVFRLGSRSVINYQGVNVDSMLTASLTVDTARIVAEGAVIAGRDMKLNFASRNVASTLDTSSITPHGINIAAGLLTLRHDSTAIRLRLRDASVRGSIQRYEGRDKAPLIRASIDARTVLYADSFNRALLSGGHAGIALHPRDRRISPRLQARYDSIAAIYPDASPDSIMALARAARQTRESTRTADSGFQVDDSTATLLRRWTAAGSLRASSMRIFTPLFPLRTRVDSLNLRFTTDSITLTDTRLTAGKSTLDLNGSIRNIRSSLLGGRRRPLEIKFDANSEFIDVNELNETVMRGMAFAQRVKEGTAGEIVISDDAASLQRSIESQTAAGEKAPFAIPANINANVTLRASRMAYSDIEFRNLTGGLSVYNGALSLDRLKARSAIGNVSFSALLSAPDTTNIYFAAGMNIRRMDLNHVLRMIPDLDSIMPMLNTMEGIVNADMALSTRLDPMLDLQLNTLEMALKLSGDSLVLLDSETFATLSKWLRFKNKKRNMIDHMDVELLVKDSRLNLYPFIFDMDRYRFGVRGGNDLGLNLDYHISVLKSPLPFKFGINIKGTPDDMKIRLGKARINEKNVASSTAISDTVRVNLVREIGRLFRSSIRRERPSLKVTTPIPAAGNDVPESADTLSRADSVVLVNEGILPRPEGFTDSDTPAPKSTDKK